MVGTVRVYLLYTTLPSHHRVPLHLSTKIEKRNHHIFSLPLAPLVPVSLLSESSSPRVLSLSQAVCQARHLSHPVNWNICQAPMSLLRPLVVPRDLERTQDTSAFSPKSLHLASLCPSFFCQSNLLAPAAETETSYHQSTIVASVHRL